MKPINYADDVLTMFIADDLEGLDVDAAVDARYSAVDDCINEVIEEKDDEEDKRRCAVERERLSNRRKRRLLMDDDE
jgi:hypothetical protein